MDLKPVVSVKPTINPSGAVETAKQSGLSHISVFCEGLWSKMILGFGLSSSEWRCLEEAPTKWICHLTWKRKGGSLASQANSHAVLGKSQRTVSKMDGGTTLENGIILQKMRHHPF